MSSRSVITNASSGIFVSTSMERATLSENAFQRMISIERRRSARTGKSLVLMLLDMGEHAPSKDRRACLRKVLSTMSITLRDTDIVGWYQEDAVVGVMFTEIALDDQNALPATLMSRVSATLKQRLLPSQFHELAISIHLFAHARAEEIPARATHPAVYAGMAAATSETSF